MHRSRIVKNVFTLAFLTCLSSFAFGAGEFLLHRFPALNHDGANPEARLFLDKAGNLFGTTMQGGMGFGTVFELAPGSGGGFRYRQIYAFHSGADGEYPMGGLISDASGNLYGTTLRGGTSNQGTVYELFPDGTGRYTEKVLYSFTGGVDGGFVYSSLVMDGSGNLYGTTNLGGTNFKGTAFELSPNGSGGWTEVVLHSFGSGLDGASPYSGLTFDTAGNLYGTTSSGGTVTGTVFELIPDGHGGWTEEVIANVLNTPVCALLIDATGNLYGTTVNGGLAPNFGGTVFEVSPNGSGGWTLTTLYQFGGANGDPDTLAAGLAMDAAGNLYGTSELGGTGNNGTVFKLTPESGGTWLETNLIDFTVREGQNPLAEVILDSAGNLYGTTKLGGGAQFQEGVVFKYVP